MLVEVRRRGVGQSILPLYIHRLRATLPPAASTAAAALLAAVARRVRDDIPAPEDDFRPRMEALLLASFDLPALLLYTR